MSCNQIETSIPSFEFPVRWSIPNLGQVFRVPSKVIKSQDRMRAPSSKLQVQTLVDLKSDFGELYEVMADF